MISWRFGPPTTLQTTFFGQRAFCTIWTKVCYTFLTGISKTISKLSLVFRKWFHSWKEPIVRPFAAKMISQTTPDRVCLISKTRFSHFFFCKYTDTATDLGAQEYWVRHWFNKLYWIRSVMIMLDNCQWMVSLLSNMHFCVLDQPVDRKKKLRDF